MLLNLEEFIDTQLGVGPVSVFHERVTLSIKSAMEIAESEVQNKVLTVGLDLTNKLAQAFKAGILLAKYSVASDGSTWIVYKLSIYFGSTSSILEFNQSSSQRFAFIASWKISWRI